MKFNSEVIKKAHAMTKEIKKEYIDVDYKVQFGLCLSYLLERGGRKMTYAEYKNSNDKNDLREFLRNHGNASFQIKGVEGNFKIESTGKGSPFMDFLTKLYVDGEEMINDDFSIVSKLLEETFGKGFRIINLK